MNRRDLRSVARYFLNPILPGSANGRSVRVVDLSIKGARIELVEPLEPGRNVQLVVATPGGEIAVAGTVLWCEIDSLLVDTTQDRYLSGIAFTNSSVAIDALLDDLCGNDRAVRIEDFRSHDRYRVTAPLTGSFADFAPVSLLDLSVRGARIAFDGKITPGISGRLRFQVDHETGPVDVQGKVMWTRPAIVGGEQAGLLIDSEDEALRRAIERLCVRGEARIDQDSLRRKFDQLRAGSRQEKVAG